MKRVAAPREPDVAVPVVVVAIHVDFALVAVPVEVRVAMYKKPSDTLPLEYSWGCGKTSFQHIKCYDSLHQVSSFFMSNMHSTIQNLSQEYSQMQGYWVRQ